MTKNFHLLDIESLSCEDLHLMMDLADDFIPLSERPMKRISALSGKTVINFFAEPSTRTRTSFEIAGKRLSADVINISASGSSMGKGETLLDTARNLDAMSPHVIVLRHSSAGAAHLISRHVRASIINGGDGMHEHPTQALLDCVTIRRSKGRLEGLTIAILGDVAHSRVARSNIQAFKKLGASVRVAGPLTLLPAEVEALGVESFLRVEHALEGADVVIVLRLQRERQEEGLIPNLRDYSRYFGLNARRARLARPDAIIMHPGPINLGVEIEPDVIQSSRSVILDQVTHGVAVRMATLCLAAGLSGPEIRRLARSGEGARNP